MSETTPDDAADAMRAVLTDAQRMFVDTMADGGDASAFQVQSLRIIIHDLATRLHAADREREVAVERTALRCYDMLCDVAEGEAGIANVLRQIEREFNLDGVAPPLTPQTTADAPANAVNESEPRT